MHQSISLQIYSKITSQDGQHDVGVLQSCVWGVLTAGGGFH